MGKGLPVRSEGSRARQGHDSLISGERLPGQQASQGHLLICRYCSAFPGEVQQDLINCVRERPESAEKPSLS